MDVKYFAPGMHSSSVLSGISSVAMFVIMSTFSCIFFLHCTNKHFVLREVLPILLSVHAPKHANVQIIEIQTLLLITGSSPGLIHVSKILVIPQNRFIKQKKDLKYPNQWKIYIGIK